MYLEKTALQTLLGKPEESRSSKNNPMCAYPTPGEGKGVRSSMPLSWQWSCSAAHWSSFLADLTSLPQKCWVNNCNFRFSLSIESRQAFDWNSSVNPLCYDKWATSKVKALKHIIVCENLPAKRKILIQWKATQCEAACIHNTAITPSAWTW